MAAEVTTQFDSDIWPAADHRRCTVLTSPSYNFSRTLLEGRQSDAKMEEAGLRLGEVSVCEIGKLITARWRTGDGAKWLNDKFSTTLREPIINKRGALKTVCVMRNMKRPLSFYCPGLLLLVWMVGILTTYSIYGVTRLYYENTT